jgi:hypothetical protein
MASISFPCDLIYEIQYLRCDPTGPNPQVLYEWIDHTKLFEERIPLAKIDFEDNTVVASRRPLCRAASTIQKLFSNPYGRRPCSLSPLVPTQHDEPEPPRLLPAQGQGLAPEPGWDTVVRRDDGPSSSDDCPNTGIYPDPSAPGPVTGAKPAVGPASQVPVTTAAGSSTAISEQQQYCLSHYGADQRPAVTYSQYSGAPTASGGYPVYYSGHEYHSPGQNPYGSYYGGPGPASTPTSDAGQADAQGSSTAAVSGQADPNVNRQEYP